MWRRLIGRVAATAVLATLTLAAGCGSGSGTADPGALDEPAPAPTAPATSVVKAFGDDDLIVFVQPADLARVPELQASLLANPAVVGLSYVSQADALKEFTCLFAADPKVVAGVTEEILPPSFRVDAGTDPVAIANLANQLRARPGVKEVVPIADAAGSGTSDPSAPAGTPGTSRVSATDPACSQPGTRLR